MRLALKVNGTPRLVAAVDGPGYLSAHLNLCKRPKDNDYTTSIRIAGTRTRETETVRIKWPELDLQVGDVVELRVLNDGEGDEPSEVRRSSEAPQNLFSRADLAGEVLTMVSEFESQLMQVMQKSKSTETPDEHKKFALAVGHVLSQLGDSLLYPIYRRHKELVPNELKGEIL